MANTCLILSATFQTGPEVKHYNQDLGETDEYSLRSDRVYHLNYSLELLGQSPGRLYIDV